MTPPTNKTFNWESSLSSRMVKALLLFVESLAKLNRAGAISLREIPLEM